MSGKPPDFQFPSNLTDVFQGSEKTIFGDNADSIIQKMVLRERSLERAVQAPDERFTLDGNIITGRSPSAEVRYGGRVSEIVARLATPGSSDTVIDVIINGVTIGTVTVTAGSKRGELFLTSGNAIASRTDELWVNVTSAGTGAAQLVVYVRIINTK